MLRLKKVTYAIAIACLLILGACNKKEQDRPQTSSDEERMGEQSKPELAPLTGTETVYTDRAIAVTINNHPDARPQSGLSEADVVYEVLAEGSVTRFLAIFQSEHPENIGPVRSARKYLIDLANGYDSLYVAHGYSPDAYDILKSGTVDQLNGMQHDGSLFHRVSYRHPPHNSYISYENMEKGAKEAHYEMDRLPKSLDFLTKEEIENLDGNRASSMTISYSRDASFANTYQYDEQQAKYTRSTAGVEMVEYETDEPILIDNIIVIETEHQVVDAEGRREIDLTSGGSAYVLQKGVMKEVEWENRDGRLLPVQNGEPVKLVPGKTWINIVPALTIVSFEE